MDCRFVSDKPVKQSGVRFDSKRMEKALKSERIVPPKNMSREQIRSFILSKAK